MVRATNNLVHGYFHSHCISVGETDQESFQRFGWRGGNIIDSFAVALISWCCCLVLALALCRHRWIETVELEPPSPTLQAIAQAQLAEVRLRKHGNAKQDSIV